MDVPSRELILKIWNLGNEYKKLVPMADKWINGQYLTEIEYIQQHWND